MVTRYTKSDNDPSLSKEVREARKSLKTKGWTQTAAAACLGVTRGHLCYVLTGRRVSQRLLAAIHALPPRSDRP